MAKQVGAQDELVRHRFQQALPANLAPIIASQTTLGLDELGRLADELVPLIKDQVTCDLRNINSFPKNRPNYSNSQNLTSKSLTLQPFSEGQRSRVCRSHIFFGKNARNCRSWCQWPNKAGCKVVASQNNTPNVSRSNSPARQVNE